MIRVRTVRVISSSRLGYRGAFLLFLAAIDLLYGWAAMIHPTAESRLTSAFIWRDRFMPAEAWGSIWVVVGSALLISAFMRQDRIGYALAIALKIGWATVAALGGIIGHVQGAWSAVAIWGGVAGMTILVSGWPEPVRTEDATVIDDPGEQP